MKPKSGDIENLDTKSIIWHIIYRHRVLLLITSNVSTLTWIFIQQAPIVVHNLTN